MPTPIVNNGGYALSQNKDAIFKFRALDVVYRTGTKNSGKTTTKLEEIAAHAVEGRVDTLVCRLDGRNLAGFQLSDSQLVIADDKADAADEAAVDAVVNGAKLFCFDGEFDKEAELGAVLRR